ncbi:MAG: radical SAM protein [Lentisphaeria bacterium]|nr:radical SAM protein [Lentisphaeria bacterium]
MLRVVETFVSIQGESTQAGRKCFFIRLEGCDLACSYCDTRYAASGGKPMSIGDLTELAEKSRTPLVEITGGEPLLQAETPSLCRALLDRGFEVMLETGGAHSIEKIPAQVRRIVDCKLPDSGMADRMLFENYALLTERDEVKFVVSSKRDFEYAEKICAEYALASRTPHLLISPVRGRAELEEVVNWLLASVHPFRLQLQMHKIIWGDRRGV